MNPGITQSDFQSHVRHRGRDQRLPAKRSVFMHIARSQQQYSIPIDHSPVSVAEQRAVGITIKGDAQVKLSIRLRYLFRCSSGIERATTLVDILPSGEE